MTLGDPNSCYILDPRSYHPAFRTIPGHLEGEHGSTKLIKALSQTLSPVSQQLKLNRRQPELVTQASSYTPPESNTIAEVPKQTGLAVPHRRNELLTIGIIAAMVLAVAVFYTCCQISGLLIDRCRREAANTDLATLQSEEAITGTQNTSFNSDQYPPPRKLRSGKNKQFRKDSNLKCAKKFHWPKKN